MSDKIRIIHRYNNKVTEERDITTLLSENINNVINLLNRLKKEGWENIHFTTQVCGFDNYQSSSVMVKRTRDETKEEIATRKQEEKALADKRRQEKILLLEKLKAELEEIP